MDLFIVQEMNSMEIIGVYDTIDAAKIAGEIWTKHFVVIQKTLNSPCDVDSSSKRRSLKVVYESQIIN
jgi:hypothetical protein